ncbi:phage tail tape measure protein [Pseudomonas delhiensis]|uniref:phage tail tape measure protein n=1 Tax=Pseudomonas delhiensis TaxID=366289 RepID=UPI003159AFEF
MATRSLGQLTLDIIAKVGGFVSGMTQAERSADKWRKEVERSAQKVGTAIGAATVAGLTALTAMAIGTVKTAEEVTNLASVANSSTTEFQKYAAGAKLVGIEQDKLADIFKDVNDKVGDFLNTGGGGLADFFTNIAPKVGVTADNFRNLSGPQALGLYVSSLEKAKVSQSDMTFYLEAIASDATALLPLLRNNSEGFKTFGDAAAAAGAIMDEKTIKAANELAAAQWLVEQSTAGLRNQLMSQLLPVLSDFADDLFEVSKQGTAMVGMGSVITTTLKWAAKTAVGAVAAFDLLGKAIGGTVATASAAFEGFSWTDLAAGPASLGFRLAKNWEGVKTTASTVATDLQAEALKIAGVLDSIDKAGSGGTNGAVKELAELQASLRDMAGKPGSFVAQTKDQQTAAKKLADTIASTEQGYQRQIALINTEVDKRKDATEVAKLQFEIQSGKLVGINALQQKYLEGLASELDRLKQLKAANEEAAKARAFGDTLTEANQTVRVGYEVDLSGAGLGDKARDRMKQNLQIQQDFAKQQADLQKQQNSGDISQELYDRQTGMLKKALAERLAIQENYYQEVDKAQADWLSGVGDAWQNYLDSARDANSQMKEAAASAFGGAEDAVLDFVTTGKAEFSDLATSILKDLARIALRKAVVSAVSAASDTSWGGAIASIFQAKGGAWSGGVQMFANGAAFTNSVVSSPTAFALANGGLGVMGEAGPEAIMPLTRSSDGSLGVRANLQGGGAGGGNVFQFSTEVNVYGGGQTSSTTAAGSDASGKQLANMINDAARAVIVQESRPGGLIYRMMN